MSGRLSEDLRARQLYRAEGLGFVYLGLLTTLLRVNNEPGDLETATKRKTVRYEIEWQARGNRRRVLGTGKSEREPNK